MHLTLIQLLEVILAGVGVGLISSIAGIGGGTLMVPIMVLLMGVDIKTAVASSLLTIVVTSTSSSYVYLRQRMVNLELALTLEPSTAAGAILGALTTISLPSDLVRTAFGIGLILISVLMLFKDRLLGGEQEGEVKRKPAGIVASFLAGMASGMFGIGGGSLKVPIMNLLMNVPIKEAVATSMFMIGLTASSGSMVYLIRGMVDPLLVFGFAAGILPGATIGARSLKRIRSKWVRYVFGAILMYAGLRLLLT